MKLPRRQFLHLAASAAALPAMPRIASALDYPTRPVRLLVGYPAGGPLDTSARLIAQWLSEHLGQQFIVENRPGAGSNLATEMVAQARPDGYTLLEISASNAWNVALYKKLNFDFIRDIVPVCGVRRAGGVNMPELLRVKAQILAAMPQYGRGAAMDCLTESLAVAKAQSALALELRSTIDLARLLTESGRRDQARQELALVYGRFTEGFETADLKIARHFMQELA
jgi:Tripartite tricarboxylate transporter family receptor